ncbi:MAG: hypothetical protein AAGB46_03250, partial [Verrucomicrobiota bacterium]
YNYEGKDYFGGMGEQIFGNTWHKEHGQSHYGQNHVMGCTIQADPSAKEHPILKGVAPFHAYSGAYKSQLPEDAVPLLDVQVLNTFDPSDDVNQKKPLVTAGWTRDFYVAPSGEKKKARVVYASYGTSEDLLDADARRFLVNACLWAGGWERKIRPDLNVAIVGGFKPSAYDARISLSGVKPQDLGNWESQVMPEGADFGGLDNPNTAKRYARVIRARPALRDRLTETHPHLFEAGGPFEGL